MNNREKKKKLTVWRWCAYLKCGTRFYFICYFSTVPLLLFWHIYDMSNLVCTMEITVHSCVPNEHHDFARRSINWLSISLFRIVGSYALMCLWHFYLFVILLSKLGNNFSCICFMTENSILMRSTKCRSMQNVRIKACQWNWSDIQYCRCLKFV